MFGRVVNLIKIHLVCSFTTGKKMIACGGLYFKTTLISGGVGGGLLSDRGRRALSCHVAAAILGRTAVIMHNDHDHVPFEKDLDYRWQRVRNIRVTADTKPGGRSYGSESVPAGPGAGTTLNPTDIF
jgi:hypothetical protein